MRGRERVIFGGAAPSLHVARVSSSSARSRQGRNAMQERKQTINGLNVTVLVNDEDAEAFDAAQAAAEKRSKSDEVSNKARKSTANK